MPVVEKSHAERVWDNLAFDAKARKSLFSPAPFKSIDVDGAQFKVLPVPHGKENVQFDPRVYLDTELSFFASPYLSAYRHRFLLIPKDALFVQRRWEIQHGDVADWITWAIHMQHVVALSTFKSGASHPQFCHAHSVPLHDEAGNVYTALSRDLPCRVLVDRNQKYFNSLVIGEITGYPLRGLRISGDGSARWRRHAARKVFEFALNYDHLKSYNLVIVPTVDNADIYFFPRRRSGRAIAKSQSGERWQLACLEVNGLMQAKTDEDYESMTADRIQQYFADATPTQETYEEVLELVDTF